MARKPTGGKNGRPQAGDLAEAVKVADALSTEEDLKLLQTDPYEGLTERQQLIARFKLRGLSQSAMAGFLKVSQPVISKEMARIREHLVERGQSIDQDHTVGETASLYEEVEHKAWELYHQGDDATKTKALALVMQAREKHTKLLMDLGRLERATSKTTVEVQVSPLIRSLQQPEQKALVSAVVEAQLSKLADPEPPARLPADNIVEGELIDDDD